LSCGRVPRNLMEVKPLMTILLEVVPPFQVGRHIGTLKATVPMTDAPVVCAHRNREM
jgi:hypothetical protein